MAEHNQPGRGAGQLRQGDRARPQEPRALQGRAPRSSRPRSSTREALADWEKVLELVGTKVTDRLARRDARRHYVTVRDQDRRRPRDRAKKSEWRRPGPRRGDLEAGYLLVDYYVRRPQHDRAAAPTLEDAPPAGARRPGPHARPRQGLPGRSASSTQAVDAAARAARRSRRRASARSTRMISEIKTEARKDDEAIEWMKKALAKSPNDPTAYEHLAERYVAMQRFPDAIAAYEKTVQLDPHNSKAEFALAQLYVQGGQPMKAAELLRKVLRTSSDEETIGHAGAPGDRSRGDDRHARRAREGAVAAVVHDGAQADLPPRAGRALPALRAAAGRARQARQRRGPPGRARRARPDRRPRPAARCSRRCATRRRPASSGSRWRCSATSATRARPPRWSTWRAGRAEQGRRAGIGTLQETLDREVRVDALVAAGRLGDPAVLGDVLPLMDQKEIAMREAATFTLGRSGDRRAVAPLIKALDDSRPSVQALACLGLAQIDDPRVGPALIRTLSDAAQARRRARRLRATRSAPGGWPPASPPCSARSPTTAARRQRLAPGRSARSATPRALGPLLRAYFARAGHDGDELVWAIGRTSGAGLTPAQLSAARRVPAARRQVQPRRGRRAGPRSTARARSPTPG